MIFKRLWLSILHELIYHLEIKEKKKMLNGRIMQPLQINQNIKWTIRATKRNAKYS